jgi:hypothetical protein
MCFKLNGFISICPITRKFSKKIGDDFEFVLHDLHGESDINVK